jgi:predicted SnoaL-like aldol condensation-catalyzing enzyme
MGTSKEEKNKALVLEAFDTLFNKRDYSAPERYWSADYIQHSAHIPPGRDGLFNLIKASPPSLKYEHGLITAEGDFVIVHGRYSNTGLPVNWIVADIVRIENGVLAEHWDVIQDEATPEQSKSDAPLDVPGLLGTLAPNGRLHVVGAILEPMPVPAFGLIMGQKTGSGSPVGSPTTISTMLEFSARHSVAPITETFPMSNVNDALEHLRSGKARYRIVLVNDHS